ncbi:MAG: 4-(cytidine 5'-diphospho)-2-C-methyl-D-erythritol kinase [Clostridia bacterium]|nr:4-(cytidine 5'-diphospho)-2-C-methyl-D-erythritol kinase [Clostridia bacterium]
MDMVTEKAYAKLNLTLAVLYKRMDGYHALDSLMQTVSLSDELRIRRARRVTVTSAGMPLPWDNTVRRAAEKYRALTGYGAEIHLVKRIPAEAGLGGGSADAAAALRGLQRLYNGLGAGPLRDLALSVGADVPFCLRGGTARAEGVGEILSPVLSPPLDYLIVKPSAGVSTKTLFSRLPLPRKNPDTAAALRALPEGAAALADRLGNALEETAVQLVPEIGALKRRLLEAGALGACMTGSGSAVFGLFASAEAAEAAAKAFPDAAFRCVCRSV